MPRQLTAPGNRRVPVLTIVVTAVLGLAIAGCSVGGSADASAGGSAGASASPPTSAVAVTDAWVRPAAPGAESAAYFTITNGGPYADALVSAATDVAASATIHETAMGSTGMTGMQEVDRVPVGAGATVTFMPGSFHLMLKDVTTSLAPGATVELRLTFEHAGTVVVNALVRG